MTETLPADRTVERDPILPEAEQRTNLTFTDKPVFAEVSHLLTNTRPLKRPNRTKPIKP